MSIIIENTLIKINEKLINTYSITPLRLRLLERVLFSLIKMVHLQNPQM